MTETEIPLILLLLLYMYLPHYPITALKMVGAQFCVLVSSVKLAA
jgi:hypothetical protein